MFFVSFRDVMFSITVMLVFFVTCSPVSCALDDLHSVLP